jgi:hypothetical protein
MNNSAAILRALIVYAICMPLAIVVGYITVLLVNSPSYSNLVVIGGLALILSAPILLRWHHPLLVLCWNLPLTAFFLPGRPGVYLPMLAISLGISVLQRAVNRNHHFISAPQITWPLLCLILVALGTARLTGGIGLHSLGNETMGGKKYIELMAGILGFFAFTARRIPPHQAGLYMALFLLPFCVSVFSDLIAFIPSSLYFIYWFISPDLYAATGSENTMRLAGVATMGTALFAYLLARYGINGIFRAGKPWRVAALILCFTLVFWGGFRSGLVNCGLLFLILFFVEGMHRTKLLPKLVSFGVFAAVICLPMASRLPNTFQRVLSFLPVNIDPLVRADAQATLDWRIEMWKALLPQVPSHLLLGKGYAITQLDYQLMGRDTAFHSIDPSQQGLALAGDYHNGLLSVILPFGIWGLIVFLWFLIASVWALRRNRLYGDTALQGFNNFLFAYFLMNAIGFFVLAGALSSHFANFTSCLGLSISLNGGICRPARQPAEAPAETAARVPVRPRLQPAFQR